MGDGRAPKRRFVRVYYDDLADDYPRVYYDPTCLASYVRLLAACDSAWPSLPELPVSIRRADLAILRAEGLLVDHSHRRFTIKGYEQERKERQAQASASASLRWNRPRVDGGRPASRAKRFKVLTRDGHKCRYCGRGADQVALDVDHIIPVREGGTDDLDNLVAACVDCNMGKSGHRLSDFDARAS